MHTSVHWYVYYSNGKRYTVTSDMSLFIPVYMHTPPVYTTSKKPQNSISTMRFLLVFIMAFGSLDLLKGFPMALPKLVLLDRDGVINRDVGAPGVVSISQFVLTKHAAEAIGTLKRHGCTVVLVTNQSCVGKGIINRAQLDEIHDYMVHKLLKEDDDARLDRLYICTSTSKEDTRYKPNPGMILEALEDFQIDAADCVLIGDTLTDLQAAVALPLRILVATGYGTGIMGRGATEEPECVVTSSSLPESILPFYYVQDLAAAVDYLVKR